MKTLLNIAAGIILLMACAAQAHAGPRINVWVNTGANNCGWRGNGGWVRPAPIACYPRRLPVICPTPVYSYWGPTVVSYSTYPVYPVVVTSRAPLVATKGSVVVSAGTPVVVAPPVCVSPGTTFRWKR